MKNSNRGLNTFIIIIAVLVISYFVVDHYLNNRTDWSETLSQEKQPYDLNLIKYLIKEESNEFYELSKSFSDSSLMDTLNEEGSSIFFGKYFYIDSSDTEYLINYLQKGNNVLLFTDNISSILKSVLKEKFPYSPQYKEEYYYEDFDQSVEQDYYTDSIENDSLTNDIVEEVYESPYNYMGDYLSQNNIIDTMISLNLKYNHVEYTTKFIYRNQNKEIAKRWKYFDEDFAYSDSVKVKGYINENINFVEFNIGKGKLLWHRNPIVFSNYYLNNSRKYKYANYVMSHIKNGKVVWDVYHAKPHYKEDSTNYFNEEQRSPLTYILSQDSLKWAWYILLFGVIAYLFFTAKRKQSAIPILFKNKNTSIEFTETIGSLYFHNSSHKELCEFKIEMFYKYIRTNYGITDSDISSDKIAGKLAQKSDVNQALIEQLFSHLKKIKIYTHITDEMLLEFHQLLDAFYKNCKK